jgi:hypothetical protein
LLSTISSYKLKIIKNKTTNTNKTPNPEEGCIATTSVFLLLEKIKTSDSEIVLQKTKIKKKGQG